MDMNIEPVAASLNPIVVASSSLKYLWAQRLIFLKTVTLPTIVLGIASVLAPHPAKQEDFSSPMLIYSAIAGMLTFFTSISLAISWRRHLILGEQPTVMFFNILFWSYLGNWLLMILATVLIITLCYIPASMVASPLVAKMIVLPPEGTAPSATALPQIIAGEVTPVRVIMLLVVLLLPLVPGIWWMARRTIVLSARAIGNLDMTWTQASGVMRGHVLGYCCAWFLAALPILIIQAIGYIILYKAGMPTTPTPLTIGCMICYQFLAFAGIALASYISTTYYSRLTGQPSREPVYREFN